MKETDGFIKAYHDFKESVDFTKAGIMPDLDNLVWFMLTGVPYVPADEDPSDDAAMTAIEQRVTILKAVFVEVNKGQTEDFIDQGLEIYDEAAKMAKVMLQEASSEPESE
jgi:hypothetical protein